jgi:hypothetical protein
VTESSALPRRWRLFHDDAEDLPIVRNDSRKSPLRLGTTGASLKGIHQIFQPVVDIVRFQIARLHIQPNVKLKNVIRTIFNVALHLRCYNRLMQFAPPRIPFRSVRRNSHVQLQSSFRHTSFNARAI